MVKKVLLVITWFPLALIFQLVLLVNLMSTSYATPTTDRQGENVAEAPELSNIRVASSGETSKILETEVVPGDARPFLLEQYLAKNKSPLAPHAQHMVNMADLHGIDWKITTAISGCESTFAKRIPSKDSFNAHGISVYTGQKSGAKFDSWEHEIEWVSRYIKERYYNRGLTSPLLMGPTWAPPSVEKGNSWANCVQFFLDEIK